VFIGAVFCDYLLKNEERRKLITFFQ